MIRTRRNITLTPEERHKLEVFTKTGKRSVKLVKRAAIILALDSSGIRKPDAETDITHRIGVSRQTVQNVKKDFETAADLNTFLQRKKRETPPVPPKATGELEARIIALACSKPPAGYAVWTLRLLADTCVELQYVDSLSHMTVSRLLKKHALHLI
jgi:transposase